MAALLTPETFEFFARYLLAGYIVIIVRSRFVIGLRPNPTELIVEAIIFSLIVQLIVEGLYLFAALNIWRQSTSDVSQRVRLFVEVLVLPALFGAALGWNLSSGWKNAVLRRLSVPVVHPVQRAHDFAFGVNRAPGFVIVTYEDGTVLRGFFGEQSLASSDPERSDLFLERIYGEEDGDEPTRSALISLSGVRSIEFIDAKEGADNA